MALLLGDGERVNAVVMAVRLLASLQGVDRMSAKDKKSGPPPLLDMPFEEALARLIQTDPKELADAYEAVGQRQKELERYVDDRRQSIRRGARRAGKRFRL